MFIASCTAIRDFDPQAHRLEGKTLRVEPGSGVSGCSFRGECMQRGRHEDDRFIGDRRVSCINVHLPTVGFDMLLLFAYKNRKSDKKLELTMSAPADMTSRDISGKFVLVSPIYPLSSLKFSVRAPSVFPGAGAVHEQRRYPEGARR